MKNITFSDEEKINNFDEIAKCFYESNFGQKSKTDIELLMFGIYMRKMIADNTDDDGTINFNKCSDYRISRDLGITQQKVRNLKIKSQLVNPIEYDWKAALAKLTQNARYDKETKKIILNIPDPNLYLEIQNFIEERGAFVEKQLNGKILQLRVEYYIELVIALEPEDNRKTIIKELKKQFKNNGTDDLIFDDNNIGKSLIGIAGNVTTIAASISSLISPGNIVGVALMQFLSGI